MAGGHQDASLASLSCLNGLRPEVISQKDASNDPRRQKNISQITAYMKPYPPPPSARVNGEDMATPRLARLKSNMIAFYVRLPSRLNLVTVLFLEQM